MTTKEYIKKIVPKSTIGIYHALLAMLAAWWYRNPSNKMIIIGVTGTKGKSTTSMLATKLLEQLGNTVGLTSTVALSDGKKEWLNDKKMTMLGRFQTQRLLRDMVRNGCTHAVIETSSEGILQSRHLGINYDVCVFTNLTPEHIESHGNFEAYRAAKEKLFAHLTHRRKKNIGSKAIPKIILANGDDSHAKYFLNYPADKKITFGNKSENNIRVTDIRQATGGSSCTINGVQFSTQLIGAFNAMNITAAIATIHALGFSLAELVKPLAAIEPIPGRQELILAGQPFTVMVDYAYEPESQKKLYELAQTMAHARIIHVTGSAGGGRDKSRREILGQIAGEKADIVVVTNEDPYDENPQGIVDSVARGALQAGKKEGETLFKIIDRKEAIAKALALAGHNDLVLITGKGSEQAICVANGKKIPWDDRRVVREILGHTT